MRYLFLAIFMMWVGVALMVWTPTVDAQVYGITFSGVNIK